MREKAKELKRHALESDMNHMRERTGKMAKDRRQFLKTGLKLLFSVGLLLNPIVSLVERGYAEARKTILPKGTERESLVSKDPSLLDTRNLEITPLREFGTMGPTDHEVDLDTWHLEISGHVQKPLTLSYRELVEMSSIERNVLLICPGVFVNYGRWKGISSETLLQTAGVREKATYVTVHGPPTSHTKVKRFPIDDLISDRVFLAYQVNGQILPQRHGFPLRVVAEGYYGYDWVKYVSKVTVDRT